MSTVEVVDIKGREDVCYLSTSDATLEIPYTLPKVISTNNDQIITNFCTISDIALEQCSFVIQSSGYNINDKVLVIDKTKPCETLTHAAGVTIGDFNKQSGINFSPFIRNGHQCIAKRIDYYDEKSIENECLNNNNYEYSTCNRVMSKMCENTPNDHRCILWLKKQGILHPFIKECTNNMNSPVCDYFRVFSLEQNYSSEFDSVITNHCRDNVDPNCKCINDNNYDPNKCSVSLKWMKDSNILNLQKRKFLNNNIAIDSINAENSEIHFGNKKETIKTSKLSNEQTWGSMLNIMYVLILFVLICYYYLSMFLYRSYKDDRRDNSCRSPNNNNIIFNR